MTAAATAHFIDAANALLFNSPIVLLRLYPFTESKLQAITPTAYFLICAAATFTLWGITCAIAFENPVETFLNKILSDAKKQSAAESQLLEQKSELIDAMNETVEMNSTILAQVKDVIYNIRAEVKEIRPLKESMEKIKGEISSLKKELKNFEEKMKHPSLCLACGKPVLPEFNICPYCGEGLKPVLRKMIPLEKYK
jgi:Na+/phosphate symporter